MNFPLALLCLLSSCLPAPAAEEPNALSEAEKQAGYVLLFKGKDLAGWEHKGNWRAADGTIHRAAGGGDLTYRAMKMPDNFDLRFEWRVAKGSNSGVYYRPGQYEYQILDNQAHPDSGNPRTSAASLYFCMPPSHDATKPVGQWNEGRIICQGTVIQHWVNGSKVIDFDYADPKWAAEVELLKRRGANLADRGAFLHLQDHGDPVWYRSLRLRVVHKEEERDRTPVTPADVSEEARQKELKIVEQIEKARQKKQHP